MPDGRWLNRLYYGSGHLHQLNLDGSVISDFDRDRLHREVQRTQGQLKTSTAYDRSGRVRSRQRRSIDQPWQLPPLVETDYSYDPSDNLIGRRRTDRQEHLGYDSTGRILASHQVGHSETYAYDAAANLLDNPVQGGLVRHNRLLTYQDKRYKYDALGRMIEKRSAVRGLQRFVYDAESRLVEVRNGNGSVVRMTYDPLGRRIEKTEHAADGRPLGVTRFTWDGLRLLQEHKHSQTSLYIYQDYGYEPLARVDGTGPLQKIRYYHNDLNGLPEQLTEADGHDVWHATYQVWGNTREEVREAYFLEEQNLRFQGQYLDRETGLHFNTLRFYDPDVGRFTTPDPIGLEGGLNTYAYSPNPLMWSDPLGLAPCAKKVEALRNGPQKTVVKVKTKKEANELLAEAFPNSQKVRGIGSQDAQGIRKKNKMDQFKKRDGKVRYRKDYPINKETGRVYGHDDPKGTGHGELPHVNIKRADGTMVRIDITG